MYINERNGTNGNNINIETFFHTTRHYRNQFKNLKLGPEIGAKSVFGQVFTLLPDNRYVLKRSKFINETAKKAFETEIKVGSMPDIKKVGPRVYAYRFVTKNGSDYGEYIMDNVTNGKTYEHVEDLRAYFRRVYRTYFCPSNNFKEPIAVALYKTLLKFYQITKGFHGDLHAGNIFVLTDDKNKIKVRFIDFGTHRKFANKSTSDCIENYFQRTFKKLPEITYMTENWSQPYIYNFNNGGQPHSSNLWRLERTGLLQHLKNLNKNRPKTQLPMTPPPPPRHRNKTNIAKLEHVLYNYAIKGTDPVTRKKLANQINQLKKHVY